MVTGEHGTKIDTNNGLYLIDLDVSVHVVLFRTIE